MRHDSLYVALILGTAVVTASVARAQEPPDSPPPASAVMTPAKPDPVAVAAKVNKALQNDRSLPAGDITVSTHAATVLVSGEVDTEEQKSTVTHVAEKAAEGVHVSNNVEVRKLQDLPMKDQLAAQQSVAVVRDVNAALHADARTASLGITASSEDGRTVVLQGLVPTRADRSLVQSVAGKVKGVTRIDNRVAVPAN
jgi:osmotically-inducible protein OsmY